MWKTTLWVVVTGNDGAWEGCLEYDFPFVPPTGLEIANLCTLDPLVIDVVNWDPIGDRFNIHCLGVRSKKSVDRLLRTFNGDWGWEPLECGEDDGEPEAEAEPGPDRPAAKDDPDGNPDDLMRKILKGRASDLPKNPRQAEQN
jgi:hypothetical protein